MVAASQQQQHTRQINNHAQARNQRSPVLPRSAIHLTTIDDVEMSIALDEITLSMPVTSYFIYRDVPEGQAWSLAAPLAFFPPKDSDDLFDALRAKYPYLKTHSQRMRDATIEFLIEEREAGAAASSTQPSPWQQSCASWPSGSSFLTEHSPSSIERTSSLDASPAIHCSTSQEDSPPAIEDMTGVFSLTSSAQPKQHQRRKMTDAEKVEYRQRRIMKACDKCAKRKRKCTHNQQADANILTRKSLSDRVKRCIDKKTSPKTNKHESTDTTSYAKQSFELSDLDSSFMADEFDDFTLLLDEPVPELDFTNMWKSVGTDSINTWNVMGTDASINFRLQDLGLTHPWSPSSTGGNASPSALPSLAIADAVLPHQGLHGRSPTLLADGLLSQTQAVYTAATQIPSRRLPADRANTPLQATSTHQSCRTPQDPFAHNLDLQLPGLLGESPKHDCEMSQLAKERLQLEPRSNASRAVHAIHPTEHALLPQGLHSRLLARSATQHSSSELFELRRRISTRKEELQLHSIASLLQINTACIKPAQKQGVMHLTNNKLSNAHKEAVQYGGRRLDHFWVRDHHGRAVLQVIAILLVLLVCARLMSAGAQMAIACLLAYLALSKDCTSNAMRLWQCCSKGAAHLAWMTNLRCI